MRKDEEERNRIVAPQNVDIIFVAPPVPGDKANSIATKAAT